jgi:arylsulfatase A-like enzyme
MSKMKAIIVMYDSLNRHFLQPYGCDWTKTPNFLRLAGKAATFDRAYIGSAPTIPARREMHTGRYNFLHRSWGPLEPFDDSMPELLKRNGTYTALISDCAHYWEDGGATYHSRYNTWRFSRGQEGDAWIGEVAGCERSKKGGGYIREQDAINRRHIRREEDWPQAKTFRKGLEFIRTNHKEDNWLVQIETFDPHEPFFSPEKYHELYPHEYDGPEFDWPPYGPVRVPPEKIEHIRCRYAALVGMCDAHLGKVLDAMDELDLWRDTMLIVNTDHGFLLGEHGLTGKMQMPFYEEVSHVPLFIWDPRSGVAGQRRSALVQTIDLAPTLLDFFGQEIPPNMEGKPLRQAVADDTPAREAALFGMFRAHVYCADGRYVYMRDVAPDPPPLYDYTLMPTHMRARFGVDELQEIELAEPFSFTRGCRVMKIPSAPKPRMKNAPTTLWDLQEDPKQESTIEDAEVEGRLVSQMVDLMKANDAPAEMFARFGLDN